jgi:hypothetical protein
MNVASIPFTTTKYNAKVGLSLFEGSVGAVELTRTLLAALQN